LENQLLIEVAATDHFGEPLRRELSLVNRVRKADHRKHVRVERFANLIHEKLRAFSLVWNRDFREAQDAVLSERILCVGEANCNRRRGAGSGFVMVPFLQARVFSLISWSRPSGSHFFSFLGVEDRRKALNFRDKAVSSF
jgi:hypothetical protein